LLLCEGWHMRAEITPREREGKAGSPTNLVYELNAGQNDFRTYLLPPPQHSANIIGKLLAAWERTPRGWTLERTTEVIDLGANAFVPDLIARHESGKTIHVELFGFWTPTHLARRVEEFQREGFADWLIVASDELRCSRDPPARLPANFLNYKSAPDATRLKLALDGLL
jgi:predicted nuclease of restriction endonuclease-like RecB superfamily